MARKFNGTSDYIQIDAAAAQVSWWNDVLGRTYSGWINAPAGQSNVGIYAEGAAASNTPFWFLSLSQTNANKLRWNGAGTPTANTTATVADSTWHHIALVIYPIPTTGNWWGLYVDGVLDQSGTMASTVSGSATNQAALGALRRTTTGNFFSGKIAHWAIWNRALSGDEIRMLARGTRLPSEFEPQNYWPLTAPDAIVAQSLGKKRNHGTLVGTTFSAEVPPLVGRPQPALWHQRYARWRVPELAVPFINSVTAAHAPTLVADLAVPFIASVTAVYAPTVASEVDVPFIASATTVYTPALQADVAVPFVPSVTAVFTPTLSSASAEVDVPFISSSTNLYGLALPIIPIPGVAELTADAPTVYLILAGQGRLTLQSDDLQVAGVVTPDSGILKLVSDPPGAGPLQLAGRGILRLAADPPARAGATIVSTSGKLAITADPPVIAGPVKPASGQFRLVGDAPFAGPVQPTSGRLRLASDPPRFVGPVSAQNSGRLQLSADPPTFGVIPVVLAGSGILRLRSDVPVIPNLKEPTPPPPGALGVSTAAVVT